MKYLKLAILLLILAITLYFAVTNRHSTILYFEPTACTIMLPVSFLIIVAICIGTMIGYGVFISRFWQQRQTLSLTSKRVKALENEVASLRAEAMMHMQQQLKSQRPKTLKVVK